MFLKSKLYCNQGAAQDNFYDILLAKKKVKSFMYTCIVNMKGVVTQHGVSGQRYLGHLNLNVILQSTTFNDM